MRQVLDGFVVLEGLDGAGTTTQRELLVAALGRRGRVPHATWEPTDGPIGQEIRKVLRKEVQVHPLTLALLFAADRNEHLYHPSGGILARITRGEVVVSDRYLFSSLAYQSEGCGFERVLALNESFPLPRHLVFVDTPVAVSQERLRSRGGDDLFDAEAVQRRILEAYERAMRHFGGTGMAVHRIDGTRAPERICADICEAIGL